jgi:hypothetical protein
MTDKEITIPASSGLIQSLRNSLMTCVGVTAVYVLGNIWLFDSIVRLVKAAANPFFAILIITTTVLGQVLTLFHAFKLFREAGLVQSIKNAVALRQGDTQVQQENEVSEILGLLPESLASWQLFSNFRAGRSRAQGYDQPFLRTQLQAFEDTVSRRVIFPQYIANTLIGLGLFGTFLGLIVTLKEVAGLIGVFAISGNTDSADMMGQFFQKMSGPLAGMGEAFVASLLGLGGSIINNLQLLSFKKLQVSVLYATETSYLEVAEIIYGPPTSEADGKQVALDVRLAQLQLEEITALRLDISKQTDAILIAAAKMRLASESMGKTMDMLERVATQEDMRPNFDRLAIVMEQRLNTIVSKLDDTQIVQYGLLNVAKEYNERFGQIGQQADQIIHHVASQVVELSFLRRELSETDALARGCQQQTIETLKESIHRDMGVLAAAVAEDVRVSREQNQTLTDINSQTKQTNLQLKAMVADTRRAIEHVQPQIVEMIARLEKTEQTHEYVAKYDWGQLHNKVDKLQATLNGAQAPLRS